MANKYTLPDLPYDYSALEPVISGEIMELHHKKHHAGYVNKLNEALDKYQELESKNEISAMIALQGAIKFNGGGHVNHTLFWQNLAPEKDCQPLSKGALSQAIDHAFGSFEKMKEKFNTKAAAIQGSGWGWLAFCQASGRVRIVTCANQDPASTQNVIPLMGVDVWEHAYYLQYKNLRPDYLKEIWKVIDWKAVEKRFDRAVG